MLPKDQDLHRAASRLVASLVDQQLLAPRETPAELEKRVYEALRKNFQQEAEIDREAERILAENRSQTVGMDQRKLLQKIKEKLARERGFIL